MSPRAAPLSDNSFIERMVNTKKSRKQLLEDQRRAAVEEAIKLGRRSIYHATHRDAYSGGTVNCKLPCPYTCAA